MPQEALILIPTGWGFVSALCSSRGARSISLPSPIPKAAVLTCLRVAALQLSPSEAEALAAKANRDEPLTIGRSNSLKPGKAAVWAGLLADEISRYFNGQQVRFTVPADLGDLPAFHRLALRRVRRIPYGSVRSYSWVARRCGNPKAARAVGAAMSRNPVPILIPCHRVVGTRGDLVGFGGGLALKRRLLSLEGVPEAAVPPI